MTKYDKIIFCSSTVMNRGQQIMACKQRMNFTSFKRLFKRKKKREEEHVTETMWPTKPKICTLWSFSKMLADHWSRA